MQLCCMLIIDHWLHLGRTFNAFITAFHAYTVNEKACIFNAAQAKNLIDISSWK